jgi:hypothetical protein
MLFSRLSYAIGTNVFGEIRTTHKSPVSSCTSSRDQNPNLHTPWSMQGLEANLDEHGRTTSMFQ